MANMSLETIIGFIILLVVAGVIISMILTRINSDSLPYKEIEMQQMEFKNKCDALCTESSSLDYCRYYFEGGKDGTDWDGNGGKNELISIGEYVTWDVCEERIYCFSMVPCDRRFGSSPAKGCASALCQAYLDKYKGNVTKANAAVHDKIKPGACRLPANIEDNWFEQYFPADVCGIYSSANCGNGVCEAGECSSGCTADCTVTDCCGIEGCNAAIGETAANCADCSSGPAATLSNCVINKTTTPYTITCDTNCNMATQINVVDMAPSLFQDLAPIANGVTVVAQPAGFDNTYICTGSLVISIICTNPGGNTYTTHGCV